MTHDARPAASSNGDPADSSPRRTIAEVNERRKAARDARLAQQAKTADTPAARRLGTTGGNATPAGQSVADPTGGARRDARYALREAAWGVTRDKGLKNCGRSALAGGVTPVLNNGVAHYAGLVTCGKIHLCPVCGPKIRAVRAESMDAYGRAWEAAPGRRLAMMTLTMRHYERQALKPLVKAQHAAWVKAFGNRAGKQWQAVRKNLGIVGYVRAWEVTHGANGWHPHFHVLLWLDEQHDPAHTERWTEDTREWFEAWAHKRWERALKAVGGYSIAEGHGVRVDVAGAGETGVMARYLTKLQDGSAKFERVGQEMNRQDLKTGKRSSRTPFEILQAFADTGDVAELELWHEYEQGSHGVRALSWSRGMEALLAELVEVDTRTDEEIAAEEVGGEPLALIPANTWYRHIVSHRGRALQLLRVAESIGQAGVRHLIGEWGLVWGRDVLDPPPPAGS